MRFKSLIMGLLISSGILSNAFAVTLITFNQSKIADFEYTFTEDEGTFSQRPTPSYDGNGIYVFHEDSAKGTAIITIYPAGIKGAEPCIIKIHDLQTTLVKVPSMIYSCEINTLPNAATVTFKDR